ncbi:hypothetical protein ACN47A_37025 [Myxococcus fulvus]|uniref:hypothetical protein n=1 Tax=Myxococcus fulvus TaxID=33 RepID=UPI003B9AD493
MKVLRKQLLWSVAVLLAVSAVVFGGSPASAEPSEEAVCSDVESREAEADLLACPAAICLDANDCWFQCSNALSVECVEGVCAYQLPNPQGSGGGGGGGGGSLCSRQICFYDVNCLCDGQIGTCGDNGICQY